MTGNYRKRFVILTMALISVVLLTAFTVQGVLMCRNDYRELQTTMELMLKPWNEPNDDFRKLDVERENGKRQERREPDGERVFTPDGLHSPEKLTATLFMKPSRLYRRERKASARSPALILFTVAKTKEKT